MAAGLRYLGGETTKSVADIFGMSLDSSRRVIRKFCSAVNNNNSLRINLPKTQDELNRIAAEFSSISSTEGLYSGYIGALDGWLCCTQRPKGVSNPGDYFSGHYYRFGLNVQAVVDARMRFLYIAVAGPGKLNDNRAKKRLESYRQVCTYVTIDSITDGSVSQNTSR